MSTLTPPDLAERQQRIAELDAEGVSVNEIAETLGINPRSVYRHLYRLRGRPARATRYLSQDDLELLFRLRDEGAPTTWVAETLGISVHTVKAYRALSTSAHKDWMAVWQQIRRNPTLLALHYEFAPPTHAQLRTAKAG